MAIAFKEAVEKFHPKGNYALQIFATDLDRDAIEKARQGLFPANIATDLSEERLKRFFTKEDTGYRVRKEIREMVIFAPQNLIMDPPFTKLDILSCRNLLIYLTAEVQNKLIPLFHHSLNPGGILFLGSSETTGASTEFFSPLHAKSRLFQRKETPLPPTAIEFPSSFNATPLVGTEGRPLLKSSASLQSLADQLVLHRYAPPAVLVNNMGDILYISGRTGKYLEPTAGKANWNLLAMAREGLRYDLGIAFQNALRHKGCVAIHGLKVGTNGDTQHVDVTVQQLEDPGPLQGLVMVVFTDVAAEAPKGGAPSKSRARNARQTEVEHELLQARAEVRTAHEEMQTSQEEFRSSNEEMQSTNEELQSTNEELMTSKEEMQSLNEELQTVNAELQSKMDELSRVSNDMKNLLNSTDIATLFLDNDLNVRRFTEQIDRVVHLREGDIGRPLSELANTLIYPELHADVKETMRTLAFCEKQVATTDGHWYTVRIMPYRTLANVIQGVVITFVDITAAKELESRLRKA